MKFNIITIYPDFFKSFTSSTIIGRAIDRKLIEVNLIPLRNFSYDKNHRIDDRPISGGAGLILRLEPLVDALNSISSPSYKILLGPRGKKYNQADAIRLSKKEEITLICGHFEGIDYRFNKYVDEEISIGDYILTGGEIASMVLIDSISRLITGVISEKSTEDESFNNSLLEYPQYTYPKEYNGEKIPDILFSGNHKIIDDYHLKESLKETIKYRKDLISSLTYDKKIATFYKEIKENKDGKLEENINKVLNKKK